MRRIVCALAIGCAVLVAISFCGALDARADLVAHFRVQLAVILGSFLAIAMWKRQRASSGVLLLAGVVNAIPIGWLYVPEPDSVHGSLGPGLRVLCFNAQVENPRKDDVARFLVEKRPDLVVIQEATDDLCGRIDGTHEYELVVAELRTGDDAKRSSALHRRLASGIAVESARILRPDDSQYALAILEARLRRGDESFTVLVPRLPPPVTADRRAVRAKLFDALAESVAAAKTPVLVVADLNTTPFASDFREFLVRTALRDSGAGRGYAATWPAMGVFSAFGLALDHVLCSHEFVVAERHVFRDSLGSDHFPVVIDLAWCD